jgi:hypothetical protein
MVIVYITRAACTCVTCHRVLPAGSSAHAIASGMSCLGCARIDKNAREIVTMTWNQRRGRFEPRGRTGDRPPPLKKQRRPFVDFFAQQIRAAFPAMPSDLEIAIAEHACGKGRVGDTRMARFLPKHAIHLAVVAHIRHRETPYDILLANGAPVARARQAIARRIDEVLASWRGL